MVEGMLLFLTLHLMCFEEERLLGGLSRHCFRLQTIVFKFSGFTVLLVVFIQDCHHGPWNGDFPWLLLVLPLANSIGNKNKKKKQRTTKLVNSVSGRLTQRSICPRTVCLTLTQFTRCVLSFFKPGKRNKH